MENFITSHDDIIPYNCYEYYITNTNSKYKVNKEYFIDNIN